MKRYDAGPNWKALVAAGPFILSVGAMAVGAATLIGASCLILLPDAKVERGYAVRTGVR